MIGVTAKLILNSFSLFGQSLKSNPLKAQHYLKIKPNIIIMIKKEKIENFANFLFFLVFKILERTAEILILNEMQSIEILYIVQWKKVCSSNVILYP